MDIVAAIATTATAQVATAGVRSTNPIGTSLRRLCATAGSSQMNGRAAAAAMHGDDENGRRMPPIS